MRRLVAGAFIVLAGCTAAGEEKTIQAARVDALLLQHGDVGTGFRPTYLRSQADRPYAEVRYREVSLPRGRGRLAITSTARVYVSGEAADEGLETARAALENEGEWQPIDEPGLGDESFAATVVQGGMRRYEVSWREANATGSVRVSAAQDELPLADVLELARKQERRIAEAAGS